MSAFTLRIDDYAGISRAIDLFQRCENGHRIPLLRGLRDGRIGHIEVSRKGSAKTLKSFLAAVKLPAVVLIGDDDDEPTGPDGWHVAPRLLSWARLLVLHGTGGEAAHYQAVVDQAPKFGRALIVECTSAHLPLWIAAAARHTRPGVRVVIHRPAIGAVHPDQAHAKVFQ